MSVTDPKVRTLIHDSEACSMANEVRALTGDKWSMLVVLALSENSQRFSEIERSLRGISQRMLTRTLRALERDGLVSRAVTPSVPPRVDYELTSLGTSLRESFEPFGRWARANLGEVKRARTRFDARKAQRPGQA